MERQEHKVCYGTMFPRCAAFPQQRAVASARCFRLNSIVPLGWALFARAANSRQTSRNGMTA